MVRTWMSDTVEKVTKSYFELPIRKKEQYNLVRDLKMSCNITLKVEYDTFAKHHGSLENYEMYA